ncbi:MAG: ABC transporter permease [Bacilli bacterium]|nr:ABC transporter permease [Bacilli bacterium]
MAQEIVKKPLDLETVKTQEEDSLFYFVDSNSINSEKITAPRYSYWRSVFRIFFKKKINWLILALLLFIILMTILYPAFNPYDEYENVIDATWKNLSPAEAMAKSGGFSLKYLLGTGQFGNSIFNGIWAGSRTSLSLATICAAINMLIGILIGAVWGYNKTLDAVLNIFYNIIANVPYILLITVLVYVIGSGFWPFVFALTITGWLGIAYFFRTQVLIIRDREYNLASRCLGTPMFRVVGHNILPFLISVIVTILATELPSYISMEVFLAYIGVGLSASEASLGRMITEAQTAFTSFPWSFWSPVAIASIITISLYILGQNLADASDPRTHM